MAYIVEDRVAETSTSTGTGDFTVTGAFTGFRAFSAVCVVSDTIPYMIEAVDGSGIPTGEWETGIGTYSAANTLTRTTISRSSNSNAAVSFSAGTKRVVLVKIAVTSAFRGALVKKSADQTGANYTGTVAIAWDAETYDTSSIHDNVTNNTRLTVPNGVTRVQLRAQAALDLVTSGVYCALLIKKNNAVFDGYSGQFGGISATFPTINLSSPVVTVTAGDYFEAFLVVQTDTSITIVAAQSWFAMEVIE